MLNSNHSQTPASAAEVIEVFSQAAQANRETAAREGNVIVLSADNADEVMITADLHGHRERFEQILQVAALDEHPRRHLILQEVCHGGPTYADDTACKSHRLLEEVARLKTRYPDRVHFLLSNHELAELTEYPIMKGGKLLNLTFRMGLQHAFAQDAQRVREAYCEFLRSCPLAVRIVESGIFISHSIPSSTDRLPYDIKVLHRELRDSDLKEFGPAFELVWGRDYRSQNAAAFAELVDALLLVTGHEPCKEGFATPNPHQVILDCCGEKAAYLLLPADRELTAAEVKSRMRFF